MVLLLLNLELAPVPGFLSCLACGVRPCTAGVCGPFFSTWVRSRLGCQIKVTKDLEGMLIKVPEDSMDMS